MIEIYELKNRKDYFVKENDKWFYLDYGSEANESHNMICSIKYENLPKKIKRISLDKIDNSKPELENGQSIEQCDCFCGSSKYRNKVSKVMWGYSYFSILDDWFYEKKIIFYRYGKVIEEISTTNGSKQINEYEIKFDDILQLFDSVDQIANTTDEFSTICDDHSGFVEIIYENYKKISIPRGLSSKNGDAHSFIMNFIIHNLHLSPIEYE